MKFATWDVLDPVQIFHLCSSGLSSTCTGWFVTDDFRQHINPISKGQDSTNILPQNITGKQPMLHNKPEDWRSQLYYGRSLKFHKIIVCDFSFPHLLTKLKSVCDICWEWPWFTGHIKLYILPLSLSSARKQNFCTLVFSCHPHQANINHRVQRWHLTV